MPVTHGYTFNGKRPSEYGTWQAMKSRCTNPKVPSYKHYGGRGIKVCARWLNSFESFLEDMGPRPKGLSIDRIDTDGNYEPGNCEWTTQKRQQRNRRDNIYLTLDGVTRLLAEWAEDLGLRAGVLRSRVCEGWSDERTLRTKTV